MYLCQLYVFAYSFQECEDGDEIAKIPKKKTLKVEDTKSKKEHINVVFIGHVGKDYWSYHYSNFDVLTNNFNSTICRCWKVYHWWTNYVFDRNG